MARRTDAGSHVPAAILASGSAASFGWPNHCTIPSFTMKKRGLKFRNVPFCICIMAERSGSDTTEYGTWSFFSGESSHAFTFGASSSEMATKRIPLGPYSRA